MKTTRKSKKDPSDIEICGSASAYFHNGNWRYSHCTRDKDHLSGSEKIFHDMNKFEPTESESAVLRKAATKDMLAAKKLYPDSADYSRLIDPNEI